MLANTLSSLSDRLEATHEETKVSLGSVQASLQASIDAQLNALRTDLMARLDGALHHPSLERQRSRAGGVERPPGRRRCRLKGATSSATPCTPVEPNGHDAAEVGASTEPRPAGHMPSVLAAVAASADGGGEAIQMGTLPASSGAARTALRGASGPPPSGSPPTATRGVAGRALEAKLPAEVDSSDSGESFQA